MAERRQVYRRIRPLDLRGGVGESSLAGIRLLMRLILAKYMLTQTVRRPSSRLISSWGGRGHEGGAMYIWSRGRSRWKHFPTQILV